MVQDGNETMMETFQDAMRDMIAEHGADGPQVQAIAKKEARMRNLDVPLRTAQRLLAEDMFPSPSQTGLSPDDYDLLIRWASDPETIIDTQEMGEQSINWIVRSPPRGGAAPYLLREFAENRDGIEKHYTEADVRRKIEEAAKLTAEQKRADRQRAIVDAIARRDGFESGAALAMQNAQKYDDIAKAVADYRWGKKGWLLDQENVGVSEAAGAVIHYALVPRGLVRGATNAKPSKPAPVEPEQCREPSDSPADDASEPEARMSDADMENAVLDFLRRDERALTYNQVATEMGLTYPDAWKHVSRALRALTKQEKAQIICYPVTRQAAKNGNAEKIKLYKYAPWRAQIDRDPAKTDRVVQRILGGLVSSVPALSWRALRERMREAFGHLDNAIIDRARASLLKSRVIIDAPGGPRGARLHYAATGDGAESYQQEAIRRGWLGETGNAVSVC